MRQDPPDQIPGSQTPEDEEAPDYYLEQHHDPLVCRLAALGMTQLAECTLDAASQQLDRNNLTAAAGALAAAEFSGSFAQAHAARAAELTRQSDGSPGTAISQPLAQRMFACQQRASHLERTIVKRAAYQRLSEDLVPWHCQQFLLIHSAAAAKMLLQRLNPEDPSSPRNFAIVSAAHEVGVSHWHAPQHPEPEQTWQAPDGFTFFKAKLQRDAQDAPAELAELMQQARVQYLDPLPTIVSSTLLPAPDLAAHLREHPIGVGEATLLFIKAPDGDVRPPDADHEPAIPFTDVKHCSAFLHDNARYVMVIGDPYPPGFPAARVFMHMKTAQEQLEDHADEMPPDLCLRYGEAIVATVHAAHLNLHCIKPQTIRRLLEQARQAGLPQGALRLLLEGLTAWNDTLADRLVAVDAKHQPSWRQLCSRRIARRIIDNARDSGLDEYALAELAESLGFTPTQLGAQPQPLSQNQLQELENAAYAAGLDEAAWERIANELDADLNIIS